MRIKWNNIYKVSSFVPLRGSCSISDLFLNFHNLIVRLFQRHTTENGCGNNDKVTGKLWNKSYVSKNGLDHWMFFVKCLQNIQSLFIEQTNKQMFTLAL